MTYVKIRSDGLITRDVLGGPNVKNSQYDPFFACSIMAPHFKVYIQLFSSPLGIYVPLLEGIYAPLLILTDYPT